MLPALVRLDRVGPVARLVLDDPDRRNALSPDMAEAFASALGELRQDASVRALVVAGEGKAFSAGGGFSMIRDLAEGRIREVPAYMEAYYRKFLGLRELPFPTIAAVEGPAVGAGFCLALACDLRVAGPRARFAANFTRLGLHPGMGATYLLPRAAPAAAADLLLTGRAVEAEEALRLGLVHRLAPDGRAREEAGNWARAVSEGAPLAIRRLLETLRAGPAPDLGAALRREAACQAEDFRTEDMREGLAAALARRAPVFRGR